jgi:hemerythrin-like metal-binding protein
MTRKDIAPGVSVVEVPEAGLTVLCGCPENVVKLLIKAGIIHTTGGRGVIYETGPNIVLLSDVPVQNGSFCNLAEFPVLQMLYLQGKAVPGHPGNDGSRPMLVGLREEVKAQAEYIYIGNYGLVDIQDMLESGLDRDVAEERLRMKLGFAFGSIKQTNELLELKVVEQDALELRNGVFLRRVGLNRYEFIHQGQTIAVDMNLPAGSRYPAPYTLPRRRLERADFAVTHLGEGDGWDVSRPCMGSLIDANGSLYLVDAGPNIADSLEALGIGVSDLRGVFQTHAHDDHFVGLTALLASEKRPMLCATPAVRTSIMRKFRAVANMDETAFRQFFDFLPLREGEWNQLDGLDVMPVFSPHPVETTIFHFRAKGPDGYKTFAHLADLTAFSVLDKMVADDLRKPGITAALAEQAKRAYLVPADIKKIDIGGGMIHGDILDFAGDESGELLLSHTARELGPAELAIGRRPEFGETSVLIPASTKVCAQCQKGQPMEATPALLRIRDFLSASSTFAPPLSKETLLSIAELVEVRRVVAGGRFKAVDGLLVVASGDAHIQLGTRTLEALEPGGCFGIESILFRTAPLLEGLAATDCELLFIPEAALLDKPLILWRLRERLDRKLVNLRASFPLEWTPAYSVKIAILDEQHRQEFALIEETIRRYHNSRGSVDSAGVLAVLDRLVHVTKEHFQTENSLMEQHGFPQYRGHRDEHERLLETLLSLHARVGATGAAAGVPVDGAGVPVDGAGVPVDGAGVPVDGAGVPVDGAGVPVDGAGVPVDGAGVAATAVGEFEMTQLVDFFKDWILRHTLLIDRQYMEFFVSRGVK